MQLVAGLYAVTRVLYHFLFAFFFFGSFQVYAVAKLLTIDRPWQWQWQWQWTWTWKCQCQWTSGPVAEDQVPPVLTCLPPVRWPQFSARRLPKSSSNIAAHWAKSWYNIYMYLYMYLKYYKESMLNIDSYVYILRIQRIIFFIWFFIFFIHLRT